MNLWLAMAVGGVFTYLTRFSFIFLFGILEPPPVLKRALRFVPPAVLSAIVFQELIIREGAVQFSLTNHRLVAGILAILIGLGTRKSLLVIAVGMAALLIINFLFPQ